jgi:glycosyltransferase involved in cell wall biosynthesis
MKRRKVLIISYMWAPMEGVGLMRASKFARYLTGMGWDPVVLTVKGAQAAETNGRDQEGFEVFRTDYSDVASSIKRFLAPVSAIGKKGPESRELDPKNGAARRPSLVRELILMPDDQIGWYKYAVEEGKNIIEKEGIDLIMSTSPPETAHLIARSLKKSSGLPWVADLRDLWAEDHFRQRPLVKRLILRRMEKKTLGDADLVVTVSDPWAETLRRSLSCVPDKVRVIENGYDETDFAGLEYRGNEKFTISYTGKLHRINQPIGPLFEAIKGLVSEGAVDRRRIRVDMYVFGYDKPDIAAMAERYGLSDVVFEHGRVSYEESLRIQRSSDILLFVQWRGRQGNGWYSAKLYDYIGARRPILAIAGENGVASDLVSRTSCRSTVVDDVAGIRHALTHAYREYIDSGYVAYNEIEAEVARHSRRSRTKQLAMLFDSLIEACAAPAHAGR